MSHRGGVEAEKTAGRVADESIAAGEQQHLDQGVITSPIGSLPQVEFSFILSKFFIATDNVRNPFSNSRLYSDAIGA